MTSTPEEKKPFWAKCDTCKHCWAAAYLPMEAHLFGKIAKNAAKNCPKCGATKIFVAKQSNGVLLEQLA